MKISANQLAPQLKNSLLPCYLVSGEEPLLVEESLDSIRAAARDRGFAARELFVHSTGFDWSEFSSAGGNLSLFAERRVVELRLPTGKPGVKGSASIADFAANAGDDILLLVSAPKLDRKGQNAKWVKALESRGGLVQVWPVDLRDLPGWVNQRMRRAGMQPDRDAVRLITDRVEGNLLAAQQEIEKLRLLHGEGPITADEVDRAVADSSRFDVYKLVDAAVSGDAARAVRVLGAVRAEGIEPVIVMWALTRELRILAGLSDAVAGGSDLGASMRKARVWQNRQGMVRSCVSRHQAGSFHRLLKVARRGDAAAKGQLRADPWQLVMRIILDIAAPGIQAA